MSNNKRMNTYYWNKPSTKENKEKFEEAKKGNYLCQIITCKAKAKYILIGKDDSHQKMYCNFHVNELFFNPNYSELFWLSEQKPPYDNRCVGKFEVERIELI